MSGIYIHVPFCAKRCSYCDFHFSTSFKGYRAQMVASLKNEIIDRKQELSSPLKSIYFGGGTPSLLNKEELSGILETVHNNYSVEPSAEVTLEANPENISLEAALSWKNLGVNRLSIGLQSFKDADLKWMNRGHDKSNNSKCVELVHNAGFDNVSVDLIYGLPGLKMIEWRSFLELVVSLGVKHISAYCLTVENKTKLKSDIEKGLISPLPEKDQIKQFEILCSFLKKQGYEHYEVSNFALNKVYSKHNRSYWERKKYLGIGPSAHSYNGNSRRWNVSNNHLYMSRGGQKKDWYSQESLSHDSEWNEVFLTGLRTKWGVLKKETDRLGGLKASERKEIERLIKNGSLLESKNAFVLSEKCLLFADAISESFFRVS